MTLASRSPVSGLAGQCRSWRKSFMSCGTRTGGAEKRAPAMPAPGSSGRITGRVRSVSWHRGRCRAAGAAQLGLRAAAPCGRRRAVRVVERHQVAVLGQADQVCTADAGEIFVGRQVERALGVAVDAMLAACMRAVSCLASASVSGRPDSERRSTTRGIAQALDVGLGEVGGVDLHRVAIGGQCAAALPAVGARQRLADLGQHQRARGWRRLFLGASPGNEAEALQRSRSSLRARRCRHRSWHWCLRPWCRRASASASSKAKRQQASPGNGPKSGPLPGQINTHETSLQRCRPALIAHSGA